MKHVDLIDEARVNWGTKLSSVM